MKCQIHFWHCLLPFLLPLLIHATTRVDAVEPTKSAPQLSAAKHTAPENLRLHITFDRSFKIRGLGLGFEYKIRPFLEFYDGERKVHLLLVYVRPNNNNNQGRLNSPPSLPLPQLHQLIAHAQQQQQQHGYFLSRNKRFPPPPPPPPPQIPYYAGGGEERMRGGGRKGPEGDRYALLETSLGTSAPHVHRSFSTALDQLVQLYHFCNPSAQQNHNNDALDDDGNRNQKEPTSIVPPQHFRVVLAKSGDTAGFWAMDLAKLAQKGQCAELLGIFQFREPHKGDISLKFTAEDVSKFRAFPNVRYPPPQQ